MKFFSTIFTLALAVGSCYGATVADVVTDAANLSNSLTAFNTQLATFTFGASVMGLIPLATAAQSVIVTGKQAITDAQGLPHPISLLDTATLATAITTLASNAAASLALVSAAQPQFAGLSMVGTIAPSAVEGILLLCQALTMNFETAILAAVPAAAQGPFLTAQNTINTAFTTTLATFN